MVVFIGCAKGQPHFPCVWKWYAWCYNFYTAWEGKHGLIDSKVPTVICITFKVADAVERSICRHIDDGLT